MSFKQQFVGESEFLVFAPARVNLIGEHIDYCGGDVLPMAITEGTRIEGRYNQSGQYDFYSERFEQSFSVPAGQLAGFDLESAEAWQRYIVGILKLLDDDRSSFHTCAGGEFYISQNAGSAGLSSSASFCAALGIALGELKTLTIPLRIELAQLCQKVEHDYAGVNCGIMDQMSVLLGNVIRLNCASLQFSTTDVDFSDTQIVVMDTGAARTLAGSGYNQRVSELAELAAVKKLDSYSSLAHTSVSMEGLPELLQRRLRHVQSEQRRVVESHEALAAADWKRFGSLMTASHESLRDDYEVSCEPLDTMVRLALAHPGVLGARMTGGGFGGCAIALVQREFVADMIEAVQRAYEAETRLAANLFVVTPAAPAGFAGF